MAYIAGSTILDDEYNTFVTGNADGTANNTNNNVNTVYGLGALDRGYGNTDVTAASPAQTISATQWATMLNTISSIASHQGTSISAISNPTTGNQVAVLATLAANIGAITAGKDDAIANGTAITDTAVRTTQWNTSLTASTTITFDDADAMRHFFNAGGRIAVSASRTGGTAHAKNTGWTTLLTNLGTVNLTGLGTSKTIAGVAYTGTTKIGGGGSPSVYSTATGFYDLTGADSELLRQYAATPSYTVNYASIKASQVGAVLTVDVIYQDDETNYVDDYANGTLTTTVSAIPPSTTHIANSWGTPVVSSGVTGT